jgi:hypothetical protein
VRLRCLVRDLLLLTWEVPAGALVRRLPTEVTPSSTPSGAALVSLAAARVTDVRTGSLWIPGWKQIAVRTYVEAAGQPGIFFLGLRVSGPGLVAGLVGVPVRPMRARVAEGLVRSPGFGVYATYRRLPGDEPVVPELSTGRLGSHEIAYVYSAGLRRLVSRHAAFAFEAVELTDELRIDPLLALGFDVAEPVSALYAAETAFTLELPPAPVARS